MPTNKNSVGYSNYYADTQHTRKFKRVTYNETPEFPFYNFIFHEDIKNIKITG